VAVSVASPPLTGARADAEQLGAVRAVAEALRSLGHEVVDRELEYPPAGAAHILARYLRGIADQGRAMPHPERLARRTRGFVRIGAAIPPAAVARARAAAAADAEVLGRAFGDGVDAVLTPMFTRRPPRVGEFEGRSALATLVGEIRFVPFCGAFNHTGQPAAAVPAGAAADGFPLAAQLVGRPDGEETLLSLAAQLEAATAWPERRPPL
jgi:amidase